MQIQLAVFNYRKISMWIDIFKNDYAKLYNSKSGKEIDITSTEKFWFLIQEIVNNTVKVDDLEVIGLEEEEEDEDDEEEE
jgi:hypothetical protein